jgi:DNA mismatch repair protein MutH
MSLLTLDDLLTRAQCLAGLTLGQLAADLRELLPEKLLRQKGRIGQLLEIALGATAGNAAEPDFPHLGVELKTIPVNAQGMPLESTYITTVPLPPILGETFEQSLLYRKLARVLWIPILAESRLAVADRIIGWPLLWQPSVVEWTILERDWQEFQMRITHGELASIDGRLGDYLQIRPKAAHSRVLTSHINADGSRGETLPRGFYLRAKVTAGILASAATTSGHSDAGGY